MPTLEQRQDYFAGHFSAMASPCEVLIDTPGKNIARQAVDIAANETSTVSLSGLRGGFRPQMEVQDVPNSRTRKPLGEGVIIKTRTLGGRDQVLVDFSRLGKQLWLPYENLRQIKGTKNRFILGDKGPEDSAERFRLKSLTHALLNRRASLLRWQNDQGQRMRQEYTAYEIAADGRVTVNPQTFSEWLKQPAQTGDVSIDREQNKSWFEATEAAADQRLAEVSNQYLHPENNQWVSGAWLEQE
jgi:hypothetical protein